MSHASRAASRSYAELRIEEKIARFHNEKAREGLKHVNEVLKRREIPPGTRLHYLTAVANLGRISEETLPARLEHAERTRTALR